MQGQYIGIQVRVISSFARVVYVGFCEGSGGMAEGQCGSSQGGTLKSADRRWSRQRDGGVEGRIASCPERRSAQAGGSRPAYVVETSNQGWDTCPGRTRLPLRARLNEWRCSGAEWMTAAGVEGVVGVLVASPTVRFKAAGS